METTGGTYGVLPTGHRLPAETRLGQVRLQVADLERSVDYYQEILGLRLVDSEARSASLAAQGDDRPADGQVEAAPEEVHGARFADEFAPEPPEDSIGTGQHLEEAGHLVSLVRGMHLVFVEGDRVLHFHRPTPEIYVEPMLVQRV